MVEERPWQDFSSIYGWEHPDEVFSLPVYCRVPNISGNDAVRIDFKDRDGDLAVQYSQKNIDTDAQAQSIRNPKFILIGVVGDTL